MTLIAIRVVFLLLCGLGSWSIAQLHDQWFSHPYISVIVGLVSGVIVIGIDKVLKGFSVRGLSAATFGLFVGFLMSYFVGNSVLFEFIESETKLIAQIIMYVVCSYLAMVIALRGKDDFNLIIPYVKFRREDKPERIILLDTNIIIDGRIMDVCETGFLNAVFVVPRFILHELQFIADSNEDIRRARGLRGLEVLKSLQNNTHAEIKIHENEVPEIKQVDGKLVQLAKMLNAEILTNDYNLNRIAELQRVRVLNLHELAKALRPVVLPGEKITMKLVKEGREPEQAVAYLEDGTMVVVNHARRFLGQEVEIIVSSVLQTAAGRLAFAEVSNQVHDVSGNGNSPTSMEGKQGTLAPVS